MTQINRGTRSEVVSSEAETLILVDSDDRAIGQLDKSACHDGSGRLHRAFSVFIFNAAGDLLIQQRAADKRLWPSFWSNSCCSHPRTGETMDEAIERRCLEELGFAAPLEFLYKFEYHAQYGDVGSERELCSVFAGTYAGDPNVNTSEIQAWRWIAPQVLTVELRETPERFTPWFKMEWRELTTRFAARLPVEA